MHKSIATIDSPEFVNLQAMDINPLMSTCEIKVLYVGENRNGSYIDKETATKMAETLRGCPIVGYYKQDKEDFADHGQKVTIDGGEIKFECMTKPYGFVAPDAKVWFKKFDDFDDFGNPTTREYLMTTGYLWTGQFEEAAAAINEGRPQSMELDENTLDGKWSQNTKTGLDFFIINDATFSKLCILGDDVEPCFEGASVTSPEVSTSFALDDDFKQTLFSMMQDLKFALEGGQKMNSEIEQVQEEVVENAENIEAEVEDKFEQVETDKTEEELEAPEVEFVDKKDEDEEEKEAEEESSDEDEKDDSAAEDDDEDKEEKKKYSLLEEEFNALKDKYTLLEEECNSLREFKLAVELKEKEQLIDSFYMLSEEDKADVRAKINEYSLRDIKAELSIKCFDNKVSFNSLEEEEVEEELDVTTTFTVHADEETKLPAWIQAVKAVANERNQ